MLSRGNALDYLSLGCDLALEYRARDRDLSTELHITGSWSRGKVLDYRSLGRDLEIRHWAMHTTGS